MKYGWHGSIDNLETKLEAFCGSASQLKTALRVQEE